MNILIERTIELNAPLLTEPLPGSLFTTENKAHQFLIACTQSGLPVTLSGTVSAKFIREANNTTILMSGSISGGKASLILPADCYNISGRFDLTIFVTSNNVTTCIYSATGSVKAAQDGTLVDEGTVVPSIEQLQQDVTNLQNGKVDRAGDTMTGPLNLRSATVFSTGDGYARLYYKDTASGANLAAFNLLVSNRRLFATEYSAGSSNVERFYFPAPDANRTADGNYDVLTSKSPVTIAQGGNGRAIVAGSVISLSYRIMCGHITSSRKNLCFDIPLFCDLTGRTPASLAGSVIVRCQGGYIGDAAGIPLSNFTQNLSIGVCVVRVALESATELSSTYNNYPISVQFTEGSTLTFA